MPEPTALLAGLKAHLPVRLQPYAFTGRAAGLEAAVATERPGWCGEHDHPPRLGRGLDGEGLEPHRAPVHPLCRRSCDLAEQQVIGDLGGPGQGVLDEHQDFAPGGRPRRIEVDLPSPGGTAVGAHVTGSSGST